MGLHGAAAYRLAAKPASIAPANLPWGGLRACEAFDPQWLLIEHG
jgi:hypothetical protein